METGHDDAEQHRHDGDQVDSLPAKKRYRKWALCGSR
jgi:hypothetical protein